jgi:hypothetical protein
MARLRTNRFVPASRAALLTLGSTDSREALFNSETSSATITNASNVVSRNFSDQNPVILLGHIITVGHSAPWPKMAASSKVDRK